LTEKPIASRASPEWLAVLACCAAASMAAVAWSWRHGAMLNYGDAVAHLHIARRVFDAHQPRLTQLGSVWLPLPHLLLLPFVQVYSWWANGIAGVIPSALAYLAGCAGIYRLARRWLRRRRGAGAGLFRANPNLLYLQTTAMTEPLFVCEMIWVAVWLVEWRAKPGRRPKRGPAPALVDRRGAGGRGLYALRRLGDGAAGLGCMGLALLRRGGCARAPSGWPALWWSPRRWRGSFTTPRPSAIGSTSCAGLTRPRPSRCAPPCRDFRRIRAGTIRGWR
jgi:hypothetical protein